MEAPETLAQEGRRGSQGLALQADDSTATQFLCQGAPVLHFFVAVRLHLVLDPYKEKKVERPAEKPVTGLPHTVCLAATKKIKPQPPSLSSCGREE